MGSIYVKQTLAIFAAMTLVLGAGSALAAKKATGVKCGNSYIAAGKTRHKDAPKHPDCKKGKLCGDTCIAKDSRPAGKRT